jgi:LPXTG-motif cell wall-anchored protein
MIVALAVVLASWCPTTTTTGPEQPACPCPVTTTTTAAPETTTSTVPTLIVLPPDPFPPAATTTTTAPAVPDVIVDAVTVTRPAPVRRLPETGQSGRAVLVAGVLLLLGGLFVAARPGRAP